MFLFFIGAWITTCGNKRGVMELVGDAVREYNLETGTSKQQIVLVGIVSWGLVEKQKCWIDTKVRQLIISYFLDIGWSNSKHFL